MVQRIFDVENEKDYEDLWNIISEEVFRIVKQDYGPSLKYYGYNNNVISITDIIQINWHDKTEITRPIQECTEQDIGKLCAFWDYKEEMHYGRLNSIIKQGEMTFYSLEDIRSYYHARRLTKQEIKELC